MAFAVGVNAMLGALMTLGIGMYAPCMILIALLGMNPKAAYPIMMGSCAFLLPTCGVRFIRKERYNLKAALGLAIGGIPGVLAAAFVVKELPLDWVRWLVIAVAVYTAIMMLRSAKAERHAEPPPAIKLFDLEIRRACPPGERHGKGRRFLESSSDGRPYRRCPKRSLWPHPARSRHALTASSACLAFQNSATLSKVSASFVASAAAAALSPRANGAQGRLDRLHPGFILSVVLRSGHSREQDESADCD